MEHAFTKRLKSREINNKLAGSFAKKSYIDGDLLQRLQLEQELTGHTGCVNCLDWNESGQLLASGSDDTNVILWNPFTYSPIKTIKTGHHGNIFSVKFFPQTNDQIIASGAADFHVFMHDINYSEKIHGFSCNARVKRLVTHPAVPRILWCASEDGKVREFDMREPEKTCVRVLVNLTSMCGPGTECKCLAINPMKSNLLAVGVNDPYVRLYDRRMIKVAEHGTQQNGQKRKDNSHNLTQGCVSYFIPGHLRHKQKEYQRKSRYLCSTYVAFSPNGDDLLVNIGGEQVYLFDFNHKVKALYQPVSHKPRKSKRSSSLNGTVKSFATADHETAHSSKQVTNGCMLPPSSHKPKSSMLPPHIEKFKEKANDLFSRQQFSAAIMVYNAAIDLAPKSSVLYGNRAAAYIKRAWDGDMYAALRDCYSALAYNSEHIKAHFRLVRCLYELRWLTEAQTVLQEFKQKYPDYAKSKACIAVEKDIKSALKSPKKREKDVDDESSPTELELQLENEAFDYKQRYCGHCNTTTDIKEANFFGNDGQYVIAGSDDGSFFVWERKTANLVRVMHADDSIVNCLQPHPHTCMLATSGIDPVVRLWSPMGVSNNDERTVFETEIAAAANQKRMNTDPIETMLLSMGMRTVGSENEDGEVMPCRAS